MPQPTPQYEHTVRTSAAGALVRGSDGCVIVPMHTMIPEGCSTPSCGVLPPDHIRLTDLHSRV